jgi:formate dehydrogenase subunit delta
MSHDQAARLVSMANQIASFFASQRHRDSGEAVADHLRKFWTPIMRDHIRAHLDSGGAGLSPVAREGVLHMNDLKHPIPAGPEDDSSEHAKPSAP